MEKITDIHELIKQKGDSLRGNILIEKIVRSQTGKPLDYWLRKTNEEVEHTSPVYEPTIEDYRKRKKDEILRFDSSSDVNEFRIKGISVWLDKATRAGLMLRFQAEKAMGKEDTSLWYEGHQFELTIDAATQMLYMIENYASACYDNTQRHLSVIDNLSTKDELDAYDYRAGYPDKLEF